VRAAGVVVGDPAPDAASLPDSKAFRNTHSYLSDPQPFDEDVVHPANATVHRDADASLSQCVGEGEAGELRALDSIENVGLAMTAFLRSRRRSKALAKKSRSTTS
jgi:hypothetical protein